jgi:hypothetical protein
MWCLAARGPGPDRAHPAPPTPSDAVAEGKGTPEVERVAHSKNQAQKQKGPDPSRNPGLCEQSRKVGLRPAFSRMPSIVAVTLACPLAHRHAGALVRCAGGLLQVTGKVAADHDGVLGFVDSVRFFKQGADRKNSLPVRQALHQTITSTRPSRGCPPRCGRCACCRGRPQRTPAPCPPPGRSTACRCAPAGARSAAPMPRRSPPCPARR